MVNGKPMSVHELKVGMKGRATMTTRTTVTPVSVTEVKNGTVMAAIWTGDHLTHPGRNQIVHTRRLRQAGRQYMRAGKPAKVSDFRQGDLLTATIITSKAAAGHEREASERDARDGRCGIWRRSRLRSLALTGSVVDIPLEQPGTGAAGRDILISGCRAEDAAEDGQLVAVARARERPDDRVGRRPDTAAPLRSLAGCVKGKGLRPFPFCLCRASDRLQPRLEPGVECLDLLSAAQADRHAARRASVRRSRPHYRRRHRQGRRAPR